MGCMPIFNDFSMFFDPDRAARRIFLFLFTNRMNISPDEEEINP